MIELSTDCGIEVFDCQPIIENCSFRENEVSGNGGGVLIDGGQPTGTGFAFGGSVIIQGGHGSDGGGNASGGSVNVITGDAKAASATGGSFSVVCGVTVTAATQGGNISFTTGNHSDTLDSGTAVSGSYRVTTGTAPRFTGDMEWTTGNMTSTSALLKRAGDFQFTTGFAPGSNRWDGGEWNTTLTADTSGGVDDIAGTNTNWFCGNNGVRNHDGGHFNLTLGNTFGFNTRQGGSLNIFCGSENNGTPSSRGGGVYVQLGSSAAGEPGHLGLSCADGTFSESDTKFWGGSVAGLAVASGGSTVTIATLNHDHGTNERVEVYDIQVSGTDTSGGFASISFSAMAYRTGGTVSIQNMGNASTATLNTTYKMSSGAGFGDDMLFQLTPSGNTVLLQVSSGGGAHTGNFTYNVRKQLGGSPS